MSIHRAPAQEPKRSTQKQEGLALIGGGWLRPPGNPQGFPIGEAPAAKEEEGGGTHTDTYMIDPPLGVPIGTPVQPEAPAPPYPAP